MNVPTRIMLLALLFAYWLAQAQRQSGDATAALASSIVVETLPMSPGSMPFRCGQTSAVARRPASFESPPTTRTRPSGRSVAVW